MLFSQCTKTPLYSLAQRAKSFLSVDMGIEDVAIDDNICEGKPQLFGYTSMIATMGAFNGWFVMSFEERLLEAIAESFLCENLGDVKKDDAIMSLSDEIPNTVIGNVLSDMVKNDLDTSITPPIGLVGVKEIRGLNNRDTLAVNINSRSGKLSIIISFDDIYF